MDDTEMLARLREEVAALRSELVGARARLDATVGRSPTMRRDGRCPACGGRKLLAFAEVLDRADSRPRKMSLASQGFFRDRPVGQFEIMVCVSCNLVEWYVKD